MTSTRSALDADWLGVCRRAVEGLREMLAAAPTHRRAGGRDGRRAAGRRPHAGDRPRRRGRSCSRSSTGCATRATGSPRSPRSAARSTSATRGPKVIIDPIDGSLNAKRRIPHHALSIAVADGDDDGGRRVRVRLRLRDRARSGGRARRGRAAQRRAARPDARERRGRDGRLEVLGIESADPRWVAASIDGLESIGVPAARARDDRLDAVPGRGREVRRDGVAAAGARRRRRRGPADRPRGGRLRQLSRAAREPPGRAARRRPRSPVVAARAQTLRELEALHRLERQIGEPP